MKDHYQTLGVERGESRNGIRRAFRRRAKECHPDLAGEEGAECFRQAKEAYLVLSDPILRRVHDRDLAARERTKRRLGGSKDFLRPFEEPDVSDPGSSFLHHLRRGRGWWGHIPPADAELILTPWEAAAGGVFRVRASLWESCPACSGLDWRCGLCLGQGGMIKEVTVDLVIPAGIRGGQVYQVRVPPETGLDRNLKFLVTVR